MSDLRARLIILLLMFFSRLPLAWCRAIGAALGHIVWWKNGRARKTTQINIDLCFPELDTQTRNNLAKRSLVNTCKLAVEMGPSWLLPAEQVLSKIKACHGRDLMNAAVESGKGVILLAPHIGNWEVLGVYLGEHYKSTNFYQPPKSPLLDKLIYAARSRNGSKLAATDRKGIMTVLKTLKAGGLVGILPDQEPDRQSGVFAPFFGVQALTMTLVSNLVAKTGARVVCGIAKRSEENNGYELYFIPADEGIYSSDIDISVAALNRSVENCIALAQDQYQWEYKRFKRRPDNEPTFYPKG